MRIFGIFCIFALFFPATAIAVSTPVTYQGSLQEGGLPANGPYDFAFQLKTAGGTNVGSPILLEDIAVVGGVFTVQLDFGASVFLGSDRRLGISVRPGASVDPHTALTPDAPLTASPYSLYSNAADEAFSAGIADDVIANAIDNSDVNTGAINARTIQDGAVGTVELANSAVTTDKLASNSVTLAKVLGANYTSPANLNATIPANDCNSFDVPVGGGFEPGDAVVLNTLTVLPEDIFISVQGVVSTNVVRMKFCNVGTASQSIVNAQIRMISFR